MADYNSSYTGAQIDTAVGKALASPDTPAMDGTAAAGSSNAKANADHVHPTDTSRAAKGDLASPGAEGSTNTTGATIAKGTFFYLDGVLVQALADIQNGATFTQGTNYSPVTAGALNTLVQYDSGWKSLSFQGQKYTGTVSYRRVGELVFIKSNALNSFEALSSSTLIGNMDDGFRPSNSMQFPVAAGSTGELANSVCGIVRISSGGEMKFYPASGFGADTKLTINYVYPV